MDNHTLLYENTKKLPEVFTKSDISKMIITLETSPDYLQNVWGDWMRARDKAIMMTIYALDLRPKEACKLKFEDFDLRALTVHIHGENNKTGKDRVLPIPNELGKHLRDYLNTKKFPREMFWKGSPYLFPSYENNFMSPGRWKHIFREKILKPSGLWLPPEEGSTVTKYRSYTLRHTKATELMNETHDLFLVANVLGHAKLNSTKVYLHKDKNYLEYMRNRMNSVKQPPKEEFLFEQKKDTD
jgi:integrase/recombinase XerC